MEVMVGEVVSSNEASSKPLGVGRTLVLGRNPCSHNLTGRSSDWSVPIRYQQIP